MQEPNKTPLWLWLTAVVTFSLGALGFVHELFSDGERPWVLGASLGLLGLIPFAIVLEKLR